MKLTIKYGRGSTQWISYENLKFLKIKKYGFVGGCTLIPFVVTTDGKRYFIKK